MATRRERVVIEVDDRMTSEMARAAASVALVRSELDRLNRTRVDVNVGVDSSQITAATREAASLRAELDRISRTNINANVSSTFTSVTRGSQQANGAIGQTGDSINQLTGRLSLLADAALILGPGLIPIAAVGAQALGGLTLAATAAAVAGGSAMVAFQGLGDAVEAVHEYQLEPTVEGLEKAREAMSSLGPDARRFVMAFQEFRPVLGDIKDAAARGWFPGLTESLESFEKLGPVIEDIFFKAGEAGGFLVDGAADSLASERWTPFMEFIADEVPTAMGSLSTIMGDLAHGAAEMFQAFDPGNDAFLGWLEGVAQGFDNWASSTSGQDSIEGFLAYARESGPEVGELFSSLVGALSAIVQAAAPLGGPVLAGLTAVSEAIRVIAESDMATPILAAVAAMRIFNRLSMVALTATSRVATAPPPMIRDPNAPGIGPMTAAQAAFVAQQNRAAAAAAAAARRAQARSMAMRAAPAVAAMGLLGSGAADDLDMTNTAMGALIGTMAGPWGAAVGAAAGLALDAASANNDLADSFETANAAISSGNLLASVDALTASREKLAELRDVADTGTFEMTSPGKAAGSIKNDIEDIFGASDVEEGAAELARLEERAHAAQVSVADLGNAFGMATGPVDGSTRSITELNAVLEAAKPAMDALGISAQDYAQASSVDLLAQQGGLLGAFSQAAMSEGGAGTEALNDKIAAQAKYMDSAQGKADNYTAALGALVREEGSAAEQARGLNEALDAMIDPALNAEEALSNYREALKEIQNLNADGGFTVKNETGRANLSATRDFRQDVEARLVTMVEAGRTEQELGRALENSRKQFIQSGIAAGFSARQMRKRADAIGLTPKLVQTTFKALGISETDRKTQELRGLYRSLPKELRTHIRNEGIPKSMSEAKNLANELDLTARERRALMRLVTEGEGNVAAAKRLMDSVQSKTATVTIVTQHIQRGRAIIGNADGGMIPKDGKPYGDSVLSWLAPGEEIITNRNGEADQYRADRAAGRIPAYADGGRVGDRYGAVPGPAFRGDGGVPDEAERTRRGLKAMQKALKETSAELAKERDLRKSVIDSTRANFSTDPFAKPDSVWAGGGDPISSLMGSIGDLREFQSIVKTLKRRGLDGAAFQEADTLEEARVLQGMSRSELRRYEQLYEQRQRLVGSVGRGYADAVGATSSDIAKLQRELRRIEKAIKQEAQKDRNNRDRNTDKAADDRRNSARRAAQRRRRNDT